MASFLSGFLGPALTTATNMTAGYQRARAESTRAQIDDALRERLWENQQRRQQHEEDARDAITSATMRRQGFIPDAERAPDAMKPLGGKPGDELGQRYGASVGGYVYDNLSAAAQAEADRREALKASIRRSNASADRTQSMIPAPDLRQKLIGAGNDEHDVDAVLSTGDPVAVRGLLRPSPSDTHATNRQYDIAHPLPKSPRTSAMGETTEHRTARQNAAGLRGQLAATTTALGQAQRAVSKQPAFFASPADSTAFVGRQHAAEADVSKLRHRADSLTNILDQENARMQGSDGADHPGTGGSGLAAELVQNKARHDRLVAAGADPAEAKAALDATNAMTRKKYVAAP